MKPSGENTFQNDREKRAICVAAFYEFADLGSLSGGPRSLKRKIEHHLRGTSVLGTLIIADEGINATVAGPRPEVDGFLRFLRHAPTFEGRLRGLSAKLAVTGEMPFAKRMVKVKSEIVTMRTPGVDPRAVVGEYVEPEDWNALIDDPDTVVIDTRNDFEVEVGTFVAESGEAALDPGTTSFSEFPAFVERHAEALRGKRIAMFCTGGIRCEKATSYLKARGFGDVFHLKGGILGYLEKVPRGQSRWRGECFVFDERVTVDHELRAGSYALCRGCRKPITTADREREGYEEGVSCPRCVGTRTPDELASLRERQRQIDLAKSRGERHLGQPNSS